MKYLKKDSTYLIRFEKGEKLVETLTAFCAGRKIKAAFFQGIGTCRRAELGYFRTARRRYDFRMFRGEYEIDSLQGNVSLRDGKPFVHAHITISGPDFLARGGHLREAEVLATCETVLQPLPMTLVRRYDSVSGLSLLEWGMGRKSR